MSETTRQRMTLGEYLWREVHTAPDGTYDGLKRSGIRREWHDQCYSSHLVGTFDPSTGTFTLDTHNTTKG